MHAGRAGLLLHLARWCDPTFLKVVLASRKIPRQTSHLSPVAAQSLQGPITSELTCELRTSGSPACCGCRPTPTGGVHARCTLQQPWQHVTRLPTLSTALGSASTVQRLHSSKEPRQMGAPVLPLFGRFHNGSSDLNVDSDSDNHVPDYNCTLSDLCLGPSRQGSVALTLGLSYADPMVAKGATTTVNFRIGHSVCSLECVNLFGRNAVVYLDGLAAQGERCFTPQAL